MGHRFSKSAGATSSTGIHADTDSTETYYANNNNTSQHQQQQQQQQQAEQQQGNIIPIPISSPALVAEGPTINLQIQETANQPSTTTTNSSASSIINSSSNNNNGLSGSSNVGSNCHRQIIIKIQLAKMVNGNESHHQQQVLENCAVSPHQSGAEADNVNGNGSTITSGSGSGSGVNAQILNLTLNGDFIGDDRNGTAGSFHTSSPLSNNNNSSNRLIMTSPFQSSLERRLNALQLRGDDLDESATDSVEYVEVLEEETVPLATRPVDRSANDDGIESHRCVATATAVVEEASSSHCCRRQKSKTSKRRCCKCTCRDAFRRIMEPSSKSNKNKERRDNQNTSGSSAASGNGGSSSNSSTKHSNKKSTALARQQRTSRGVATPHASAAATTPTLPTAESERPVAPTTGGGTANMAATRNQLSFWTGTRSNNDVITINSPFLVVQCPPTSLVTLGGIDDAIRLMASEIVSSGTAGGGGAGVGVGVGVGVDAGAGVASRANHAHSNGNALMRGQMAPSALGGLQSPVGGPIVHSQVDFVHCLVPDLERITNSSFYWGKMDRYEAERLLEGKPEGTFLLRDSAQEEFLFSVTFRKYGRSLHARIEQSGHKFSFDCHDPCVFTASTVTGLLEHYKDPACVMFFEPMLTIPLHRGKAFSLQQLCRATIVSNTTYDGINEMELPVRLKSYLKEYHYKQKLRVKPFDEPFYSCT